MKELRISLDDALYERAEKLAAERGVSLDDLLRNFLASQVGPGRETERAYKARMAMIEMARQATGGLGGWKWNREELYEERLSRHERPDLRGDGDG